MYDYKLEMAKKKSSTSSNRESNLARFSETVEFYLPTLFKTLFNAESLYYIMAIIFTILGFKLHDFFYSFMLIEVVIRVRLLNNVIQAIYHPRIQIVVTLVLFLLFIYYFTIIAMTFLHDTFPNTGDTNNLISCLLRLFDQ